MKKTVALHNLGCKVNAYELEAIQQLLENRGYEIVPFAPGADVYIINTCTVTNIADRKSRQMLHKAKKMNPDAVVVACGCYVQAAGEKLEEDTAIDLIIGNNKKKDLVDILENFLAEREDGGKPSDAECKSFLVDMTHNREYETLSISKTAEHTRAFLKVQDGCNQFCTYCIIPYARGRVRSRRQSDVVEEVKRLIYTCCRRHSHITLLHQTTIYIRINRLCCRKQGSCIHLYLIEQTKVRIEYTADRHQGHNNNRWSQKRKCNSMPSGLLSLRRRQVRRSLLLR